MKKRITIMIGISGSGKSTYTKKYISKPFVYLNADSIRHELYGDPNIQGDGKKIFGILNDRFVQYLRDDTIDHIVIDNTSLTYETRKGYYGHNAQYCLVYFRPNLDVALEQNSMRDRQVPEKVIRNQFERIQEPTDYELEFCNIIYI